MGTNENIVHLSGHQGALYDACWDPETQTWLTAGGDGIVAEWNADGSAEGRAILHHDRAFFCIATSGSRRYAGTESGELFSWDQDAPNQARRFETHSNGLFSVAMGKANSIITGGGDERLVWQKDGVILGEWQVSGAQKIRCIVPSPRGWFVGTSSGKAWTFESWETLRDFAMESRIEGHEGGCYAAIWHHEKRVWLSAGRDGHIRVWGPTGNPILAFPAHEGAIYRMVQLDGVVWTAGRDKTVKAWDGKSLEPLRRISHKEGGSTRSVNALAVSIQAPSALLFGGDDRMARLAQV
jgi:WD40 repeat protein